MNKEQAIDILDKALNMANKAGAYTLGDAATVQLAINTIKSILDKYIDETGKPFEVEVKAVGDSGKTASANNSKK